MVRTLPLLSFNPRQTFANQFQPLYLKGPRNLRIPFNTELQATSTNQLDLACVITSIYLSEPLSSCGDPGWQLMSYFEDLTWVETARSPAVPGASQVYGVGLALVRLINSPYR